MSSTRTKYFIITYVLNIIKGRALKTEEDLKTLCHAIKLPFVKITAAALDGLQMTKSNFFLCLIKHFVLKTRK
jgi:hypothetical protein